MNTSAHRAARRTGTVASLAGALSISAVLGCAVANAGAAHPGFGSTKVGVQSAPAMKLRASPDERVNASGDQGDLRTAAIQGTVESALQCDTTSKIAKVVCDTPSAEATPQTKAK